MRTTMLTAALFLAAPVLADDKPTKEAVRTLELKGVRVVTPDFAEPKASEVTTDEELAKSPLFPDADSRDAIKKQLNFAKEKLVVFGWSGSGGDKLTPELTTADKKTVAVFTYKAGVSDDVRRHTLVFAVPKDAMVDVKK